MFDFCGLNFAKIFSFGQLMPNENQIVHNVEQQCHFGHTLELFDVCDPDREKVQILRNTNPRVFNQRGLRYLETNLAKQRTKSLNHHQMIKQVESVKEQITKKATVKILADLDVRMRDIAHKRWVK